MLGLCTSVWAQCEGVREVRKGKADNVFTQAGRDYIPPGFFSFRKGRAKEKNDLSNAMVFRVLTRTKDAGKASLLDS